MCEFCFCVCLVGNAIELKKSHGHVISFTEIPIDVVKNPWFWAFLSNCIILSILFIYIYSIRKTDNNDEKVLQDVLLNEHHI